MSEAYQVEDIPVNGYSEPTAKAYQAGQDNVLQRLLINGDYAWLWNEYVKNLIRFQEAVQQVNQGILRAWGLPTREEMRQINAQLYDLNNRLDELESRLEARSNPSDSAE
jgi:hypothetical protein